MSQGLVERQNLEDIADAIRSKNGSSDTYTPAEMAQAISGIHTADEVVLVQKTVNANGQYNASADSADGYSGVRVNVPNTYSASDEGKVVSNGTLISQESLSVTENGTYDTTSKKQIVVNVSGGNKMPVGSVIFYAGSSAPSGYLQCNGDVYNISEYLELADFIEMNYGSANYFGGNGTTTFAVPDWRGEFFRAAGTNSRSGQGSGGSVGEHQDQTMQVRTAVNKANMEFQLQGNTSGWLSIDNADAEEKSNSHYWMNVTSNNSGLDANASQRYASRPTNTSLLVCIKT